MLCLHFPKHQASDIEFCLPISKVTGPVVENVDLKCKDRWQPMEKVGDTRNTSAHAGERVARADACCMQKQAIQWGRD